MAILSESAALAAHAQVSSPLPSTDSTTEIPEVVVTAQRREESTQDVPIALQALTAQTLAHAGGDLLQHLVSRLMAVVVVEGFEVVHIG